MMKNFEKYKTAEERAIAFSKYCADKICSSCPLQCLNEPYDVDCCLAFWLDLKAEEEKPLPCPFCGGTVSKHEQTGDHNVYVVCNKCGYRSPYYYSMNSAITVHNQMVKIVLDAKESDAKRD